MKTIIEYEELTRETVEAILRAFPGVQAMILRLGEIDLSRGAGVISDDTKCVWTHDGHRITLSNGRGARTGACSKEPDPMAPPGVDP